MSMALFVRQDQRRSQLQEKLAADLKDKLQSSQGETAETSPAILDDDHQTKPAGMIAVVLIAVAIVVGIVLLLVLNS